MVTGVVRSALSGVFLVVATVAAVTAIWSSWAQQQLLESDVFAARTVEVIRDPGVREVTARFLADQLIAQQEAAQDVAELLPERFGGAVEQLTANDGAVAKETALLALRSGTLDGLWGAAMQSAHAQFVRWLDRENAGQTRTSVELDLQPLIAQVARNARIPESVIEAGAKSADAQIQIIEAGEFEDTRSYARTLDRGAALTAPVALVAAAVSVLLARRRRWAVMRVGLGATVAGLVVAASAPTIGERLMASMATDGADPAVARAIWASVEPPLTQLAWIVVAAGIGVALLAAILWPRSRATEAPAAQQRAAG